MYGEAQYQLLHGRVLSAGEKDGELLVVEEGTDTPGTIDPRIWPGIATVPQGIGVTMKARIAEARFAQACAAAELELDPHAPAPDLVVDREALFARLGTAGWLGLGESYLAGEWRSRNLTVVLKALIQQGFSPLPTRCSPKLETYTGGELPAELIRTSTGDGVSLFSGRFDSGVATTVRTSVKSYVPHAGRRGEPGEHLVDITHITQPLHAQRSDLSAAERRAVDSVLDIAEAGPGSRLLEYPTSGGALLLAAVDRRCIVDACSGDPNYLAATSEWLTLMGASDAVHLIPTPQPVDTRLTGRYDVLCAMEKLERISTKERPAYLRSMARLLAPGGTIALQTVVRNEKCSPAALAALTLLQAYVWPGLSYPTIEEVHRVCDRETDLRIVSQLHLGAHYSTTLRLEEESFQARYREAAASGIDVVFRRLWHYQFALRRALSELGMIEAVQLGLRHRCRQRGR